MNLVERRIYVSDSGSCAGHAYPQNRRQARRQLRPARYLRGTINFVRILVNTAAKDPTVNENQRQERHFDPKENVVVIFLGFGAKHQQVATKTNPTHLATRN